MQRNNLLNNLSKLSKVLFPTNKEQEMFLKKVSMSEYEIELLPYKSLVKYVANVGYNKINIDEIDEFYTDRAISNNFGDIKKTFFEIKEKAKDVLFEIDEVVEILKSILNERNPEKLVDLTMDLKGYVSQYGHSGGSFQFSANDIDGQEDFYYGIKEYRIKKEILIEQNVLEFYNKLFEIISENTEKELIRFYSEHSKEDKEIWLGFLLNIDFDQRDLVELNYYKFNETPILHLEKPKYGSASKEIERSSRIEKSQIKVEIAVNNYGFWKDEEYTNEMKAKNFLWHYEQAFEKLFLEMVDYIEI